MNALIMLLWVLLGTAVGTGTAWCEGRLLGESPDYPLAGLTGIALVALLRTQMLWAELNRVRQIALRRERHGFTNLTPAPSASDVADGEDEEPTSMHYRRHLGDVT